MKEKKIWRSAEAAAARACKSVLPSHRRLFYDPWTKYFPYFKYSGFSLLDMLSRIPILSQPVFWYAGFTRKCIIRYLDRLYPGGYGFITVRTRYIDPQLVSCIEVGIDLEKKGLQQTVHNLIIAKDEKRCAIMNDIIFRKR